MAAPRPYSTLPSSFANFKPTPREILGGIAPHLFEEPPRRRSTSRHRRSRSRSRSPVAPVVSKGCLSSSPLRVSAVLTAWDENGQLMGRSEQELQVSQPIETTVTCVVDEMGTPCVATESKSHPRAIIKVDKSRWRALKISSRLRTIVIKINDFYFPTPRPTLKSAH